MYVDNAPNPALMIQAPAVCPLLPKKENHSTSSTIQEPQVAENQVSAAIRGKGQDQTVFRA